MRAGEAVSRVVQVRCTILLETRVHCAHVVEREELCAVRSQFTKYKQIRCVEVKKSTSVRVRVRAHASARARPCFGVFVHVLVCVACACGCALVRVFIRFRSLGQLGAGTNDASPNQLNIELWRLRWAKLPCK